MTDFMDEVNAAVDRADWQIYVAEQDGILAELAPITLCTRERDAIKGSFDRWSDWMENLGEPLGFAAYAEAWLHCLKAHNLPPHSDRRNSGVASVGAGPAPLATNQDARPAHAWSVYGRVWTVEDLYAAALKRAGTFGSASPF